MPQNTISSQPNVVYYNRSTKQEISQSTILFPAMENNSRSANEITDDIDQLQVNVECLASQLGINPAQYSDRTFCDFDDFSENYSTMISSASRMDKFRLFALAGGSSPEKQPANVNTSSQYEFMSDTAPYDLNNVVSNTIDDNYHSASSYFRQLLHTPENKSSVEIEQHYMTVKQEENILHSSIHNQSHRTQVNYAIFDPNASNIIPDRSFPL
jgi:hypothetical protein